MASEAQAQAGELQGKLQDLNRQLMTVRTQMAVKDRERKVGEIQLRELAAAGAQTNTFKSVGKMFLQVPNAGVRSELELKGASLSDDVEVLGKKLAFLERQVKDSQEGLKEAVAAMLQASAL
ncbi:hypothetical protein BC828DRAFT_378853 [Blastocladiella britannica]|nr:hypothetical protein BC828DRAFT_378853 [Blastocladiella britannica]